MFGVMHTLVSQQLVAGQFLRAYVERYNSPPVHNLITFGSQHMGVSDLPPCKPFDIPCQLARRAVRGGVYSEWAQNNVISVSPQFTSAVTYVLMAAHSGCRPNTTVIQTNSLCTSNATTFSLTSTTRIPLPSTRRTPRTSRA